VSLPAVATAATAPAFTVELAPGPRPGIRRAVATGCTAADAACGATSDILHEAAARLEVAFGLVPGLRAIPVAALTARCDVDVASLGAHHGDAATGSVALHAGGRVNAGALRLSAPAGSDLGESLVSGDAGLASATPEALFARYFGMTRAAWSAQPAVTRLDGGEGGADAVASAFGAGARVVAVDGDLSLDGPLALGVAERPVVLVVSGTLRFGGAIALHGFAFADSIEWRDAPAGALLRGAAVSAGGYSGNADADFVHDPALLARLQGGTGSFARVDASWKDF